MSHISLRNAYVTCFVAKDLALSLNNLNKSQSCILYNVSFHDAMDAFHLLNFRNIHIAVLILLVQDPKYTIKKQ